MATQKERPPGKPTGRKYDSVTALMRGEGMSKDVQDRVRNLVEETKISTQLAELRQLAGITQADMGKALGIQQSAVSKLEAGKDEDITLKEIREYSRITGERIGLMFGKPFTPTEAVQAHANALKYWLDYLAELATQKPEFQNEIKARLGEAFYNLFNIIALCNDKLPISEHDRIEEIRMEIISGKTVPSSGFMPSPSPLIKA